MAEQKSDVMTRRGLLGFLGAAASATALSKTAKAQESIPAPYVMHQGPVTTTFDGNGRQQLHNIIPLTPETIVERGIIRPITQNAYEASIITSVPGTVHYNVVHARITFQNDLYHMIINGWQANPGPLLGLVATDQPFHFSFTAQQLKDGRKTLVPGLGNLSEETLVTTGAAYVNELYWMIIEDIKQETQNIKRQKNTQTPVSEIHTVHRADGTWVTNFNHYINPEIGLARDYGNFIFLSRIDTYDATTHVDIDGIDDQGRRIQVFDFDMIGFGSNHFRNEIRVSERRGNGWSNSRAVVDPQEMESFRYLVVLAQQATGGAQAEPNVPREKRKILTHQPVNY